MEVHQVSYYIKRTPNSHYNRVLSSSSHHLIMNLPINISTPHTTHLKQCSHSSHSTAFPDSQVDRSVSEGYGNIDLTHFPLPRANVANWTKLTTETSNQPLVKWAWADKCCFTIQHTYCFHNVGFDNNLIILTNDDMNVLWEIF